MEKPFILKQIRDYLKLNDAEFSRYLGVKPNVLSNWKARNTFDIELIYTKCDFVSPEWLLTGKGEMLKEKNSAYISENSNNVVSEPNSVYKKDEIVKLLEDKIVLLEENKAFQQEKILALERCVKCFQEEIKKLNNEIESSKK